MNSDILTLAEAAAYLKTGVKTLRKLVRVGALPARKINRKSELRFHRDALDRYVLGLGQKPAAS